MYYVTQILDVDAALPGTAWQSDVTLDKPELVGPEEGANICEEGTADGGNGVNLEWKPVAGANHYLVQTAHNSSFTGASLKTHKVSGTTKKELLIGEDVRQGDNIHWRVMAYDGAGATSPKSDPRQFKYECEQKSGQGPKPGNMDRLKCEQYGVKIVLKGPDQVMCCDRCMWHLQYAHACTDGDGNSLIELAAFNWRIEQNPADPKNTIEQATDKMVVIHTQCKKSQMFLLCIDLVFNDLVHGGQFTCTACKKVFVDCRTGLPQYKPWLYIYGAGNLIHYLDPLYWSDSIAPSPSMVRVPGTEGPPILYPLDMDDSNESPGPSEMRFGVVEDQEHEKHAIALGPVVGTGRRKIKRPKHRCHIDAGAATGHQMEARVHIALGCGLKVDNQTIEVANDELAGPGLTTHEECKLKVDVGCGLYIDYQDCKVKVDHDDLAGPGLEPWEECGLQVYPGCGLKIDGSDALAVDNTDLTGPGITTDGECGLTVNPGCGLKIDGDTVAVDNSDLAGTGLKTEGTCGLAVELEEGCGIEIDGNTISVDNKDLAGPGLTEWEDCGLQINLCYPCSGLVLNDYCLEVDNEPDHEVARS